jgi:gluconate 2-dehydrogenase gamma chain
MAKQTDIGSHLSRRDLLKQVGVVGAVVAVPVRVALVSRASAQGASASVAPARETLETLTATEAETLEAMVARLIPTDAAGPGATEARAARYIDRALGGALSSSREAYRTGLAALDRYARASKGQDFARLTPPDQDAVLTALETDTAAGFVASASFFELVLSHTIQGTFCDPYYGGNVDFVGWDLISYPGIRLAVAADDQRIDARPAPTHTSAYDQAMFSKKKPARAHVGGKDFGHAG